MANNLMIVTILISYSITALSNTLTELCSSS